MSGDSFIMHDLQNPPADVPGCLEGCTGTREVHLLHSMLAWRRLPPWMCPFPLHVLCQVDHKSAFQALVSQAERGQLKIYVICITYVMMASLFCVVAIFHFDDKQCLNMFKHWFHLNNFGTPINFTILMISSKGMWLNACYDFLAAIKINDLHYKIIFLYHIQDIIW